MEKHQVVTALSRLQISSSPCLTTSIHDLPEDVLVEILCKLPIKDMNSCKYISKLWNVLISKVCVPRIASNPVYSLIFPAFSEENGEWSFSYIRSSNDRRTREISFGESGLDTASLPFHPSPDAFRDCCNGLLLYFDKASMNYYLCNPCTHQIIVIPNLAGEVIYLSTALIFDSHYKIVNMGARPPKLNIFSLVTRQWSVHNFCPEISSFDGQYWEPHYIFLDGSIYKLRVSRYVVKIDISNPVDCREIEIPEPGVLYKVGCLGVSQGVLHYGWNDLGMEMLVWTLKAGSSDCPDEWILKYSIYYKTLTQYFPRYKYHPSVLAFHPQHDKLILGNSQGLFFYDPNTRDLEVICVFSSEKEEIPFQYPVYLFSPNVSRLEELSQDTIKTSAGDN